MSFLESRQQVAPQGIGKPVRRREDARFLTGAGSYADDMTCQAKPMLIWFARRTPMPGSSGSMSGRRPARRGYWQS
jgi:hypothetical protein